MTVYYRNWTHLGIPSLGLAVLFGWNLFWETGLPTALVYIIGVTFGLSVFGLVYQLVVPLLELNDDELVFDRGEGFSKVRIPREQIEKVRRVPATDSQPECIEFEAGDKRARVPASWFSASDRERLLDECCQWVQGDEKEGGRVRS